MFYKPVFNPQWHSLTWPRKAGKRNPEAIAQSAKLWTQPHFFYWNLQINLPAAIYSLGLDHVLTFFFKLSNILQKRYWNITVHSSITVFKCDFGRFGLKAITWILKDGPTLTRHQLLSLPRFLNCHNHCVLGCRDHRLNSCTIMNNRDLNILAYSMCYLKINAARKRNY